MGPSSPSNNLHLPLPTLALTSWLLLGMAGMAVSDEPGHETHLTSETQHQPLSSPYYNYNNAEAGSDLVSPYYPDYTYSQPSGPTALSSGNSSLLYGQSSVLSLLILVFSLERQGEAVFTFPLILTAFIAALFGGFLSPLISQGLASLREYEIR